MTGRVLTPAEADRKYFGRFPDRAHRIRVAARVEIEAARRKGALTFAAPQGFRAYVGVHHVGAGGLAFVIGILRDDADCDMGEEAARGAYRLLRQQDDAQLVAWAARQGKTARAPSATAPRQHQPEHAPRPRRNNVA